MRVSVASFAASLRRLSPLLLAVALLALSVVPSTGGTPSTTTCCGMADAGSPTHDCCCPAPAPCRTVPPAPAGAAAPARATMVREVARSIGAPRTDDVVVFARSVVSTPAGLSIAARIAARAASPSPPDLPLLQTFRI